MRALTELAQRQACSGTPVRLADVAESRDLPLQFLEQVFATLRRADVVRSRRGSAGGYALARPADEISVLEVVTVLDGALSPVECTQGVCERVGECGASSVWVEARQAVASVFGATTIGDLVAREEVLRGRAPMYYI